MKRRAPAKQTGRKAAPARARTKTKAKTAAKARKTGGNAGKVGGKAAKALKKTTGPKAVAKTVTKAGPKARPKKTLPRRPVDVVQSPPSSLDLVRRGTAARTGRAELAERRHNEQGLSPDIAAGDLDVNLEDAYFTGDEAPGGDNTTPDQDVVDEIGRALGVEYDDNEELKSTDKVANRDKHRWELDPASAEDYRDKK